MPKISIAILPNNGYKCLDETSSLACLWFKWVEWREKAATGEGELLEVSKSGVISNGKSKEGGQRPGPCKVDGLLVYKDSISIAESFDTAKVLELLGSYHHGYPQCYSVRLEINGNRKLSVGELQLVSVEERISWLRKQKELKTISYDLKRSEYSCRGY